MSIEDKRKDSEMPLAYVIATDSFMSGKLCSGRSIFAVPCYTERQIDAVEVAMGNRGDMKRPRIVTKLKADGTPSVRLHEGDHLSIRDRNEASEFYRGQAAFKGE